MESLVVGLTYQDCWSSETALTALYTGWQWRSFFIHIYTSCSGRHDVGQGSVPALTVRSTIWRYHLAFLEPTDSVLFKQGVALTGRNRTGPPCSVGRPTANAPAAGRPAHPQRYRRRLRQTTTTYASEQNNNVGLLSGPVTTWQIFTS